MKQLILHPTEVGQWHALINEAQASTHLLLNEHTESYLVFLLMRFSQCIKLIESVVALDFLEGLHKSPSRQIEQLREVGDKSLLFCGLFPGMAERRHVSLSYFSDIGQTAYLIISELEKHQADNVYLQLSEQFLTLQKILRAMRTDFLQFSNTQDDILSMINLPLQ